MKKKKLFNSALLVKLDRLAAWVLMIVILLYAITGFGMTKGIIDPSFARSAHFYWLGIVGLVAFTIHVGWGISLSFRRWRIWNVFTKALLALFLLGVIGGALYLSLFYEPYTPPTADTSVMEQLVEDEALVVPEETSDTSDLTSSSLPVFTAATLAPYNGQDGQLGLVAVDGYVYDLSSVFRGGWHAGYEAGKDQTDAFYSEHSKRILNDFPIVGTYQE